MGQREENEEEEEEEKHARSKSVSRRDRNESESTDGACNVPWKPITATTCPSGRGQQTDKVTWVVGLNSIFVLFYFRRWRLFFCLTVAHGFLCKREVFSVSAGCETQQNEDIRRSKRGGPRKEMNLKNEESRRHSQKTFLDAYRFAPLRLCLCLLTVS